MKIIFDYKIFYQQKVGGISNYFFNLGKEMIKNEVDVQFFCPLHKNNYLDQIPSSNKKGFKIFSGGTDTHLMLLDLRSFNVTGKDAQSSLGRANITCNKNGIPFDTESPMITSGIRLGTPACTTRGFGEVEFKLIAELIYKVIKGLSVNKSDNSKIEKEVKKEILDLCSAFPIYDN